MCLSLSLVWHCILLIYNSFNPWICHIYVRWKTQSESILKTSVKYKNTYTNKLQHESVHVFVEIHIFHWSFKTPEMAKYQFTVWHFKGFTYHICCSAYTVSDWSVSGTFLLYWPHNPPKITIITKIEMSSNSKNVNTKSLDVFTKLFLITYLHKK